MKRHNLVIALSVLIVLSVLGYFAYRSHGMPAEQAAANQLAPGEAASIPEGATVVTLTKDGFVPDTLTIKKGQTIAFRTTAGKLFWPASNLHPSHLLYPEFDPQQPIQPNNVWAFTFEKVGSWKFHDHLAPYFTGVVNVTE